MKLLIFPAVEAERLESIEKALDGDSVVNAADEDAALREIVDADAFFGRITPELLARAQRLRWIQAPTASMEHYLFPELIEHPAVLTNMRGYSLIASRITCWALLPALRETCTNTFAIRCTRAGSPSAARRPVLALTMGQA